MDCCGIGLAGSEATCTIAMASCAFADELDQTNQAHVMLDGALVNDALFVSFEDRLWYKYRP